MLQPSGVDIDALTGEPREVRQRATMAQARAQQQRSVGQAHRLRNALASHDGQVMRDTITQQLADRIEQLMQGDPVSQALLLILGEWGRTLAVGQRMAQALMRDLED